MNWLIQASAIVLMHALTWLAYEAAMWLRDGRLYDDDEGDDDIDGENFDPDDPQDWWKKKSGRVKK